MSLPAQGPWILPIRGYEVLQITFAYPVDVVAYGEGGASAAVRLEGEFDLVDDGGRGLALDAGAERWEDLIPLLKLRHDHITAARATGAGHLAVGFASGRRIEADPAESGENWQVSGPGFQAATDGPRFALSEGGQHPGQWSLPRSAMSSRSRSPS